MNHKYHIYSILLIAFLWGFTACEGSTTTTAFDSSPHSSNVANDTLQSAAINTETASHDVNIPSGTMEVTLPDNTTVRIPIQACGGNDRMLDIQEYTKTAPGRNPYVDVVITYPRGEGETDEGQFYINYGQDPSEPNSIWGKGTQSALMWRGVDESGRFSNVTLGDRSFSAQWKCP